MTCRDSPDNAIHLIVSTQITVTTGDVRGANTDGEVQLMMGGTAGQSDWITLYTSDANFSRGATDKFTVDGVAMGESRWVKLRLVGARFSVIHDYILSSLESQAETALQVPSAQMAAFLPQMNKNNSDIHSSWYLASIDLLNLDSGLKSTFQSNSWIGIDWWTQACGVELTESSCIQVRRCRQHPGILLSPQKSQSYTILDLLAWICHSSSQF